MLTKSLQILTITVSLTAAMIAMAETGDNLATARDLPPRTPWKHPRILTMLDETSTSDCIGRPVTPLCAVETRLACTTRGDDHLCQVVGDDGFGFRSREPGTPTFKRYLISRSTIIDDRHFPWLPSTDMGQPKGVPSVRVGDVRIDVRSMDCFCNATQFCDATQLCPDRYGPAQIYILRKNQGWWRLMGHWPISDLPPPHY